MGPFTEFVVGFDTRLAPERTAPWDAARQRLYLLREVEHPLSVDEAVWLRKGTTLVPGRGLTVETPRFHSAAEALAAVGTDEWALAITTLGAPGEPAPERLGEPDAGWLRLGYDVCEGFFPSALSNCGYDASEIEAWRRTWGPALNAAHLFDELAPAAAFRDASARRVPEHGPLSVLGLYRLEVQARRGSVKMRR